MKYILLISLVTLFSCSNKSESGNTNAPFATTLTTSNLNIAKDELQKINSSTSQIQSSETTLLSQEGITLSDEELAALNSLTAQN